MPESPFNKRSPIQFGKDRIVSDHDSPFGPAYKTNEGWFVSPPIRARSTPIEGVSASPLAPVIPFSNGSQAEGWHAANCDQCARSTCALKHRLESGFITGSIPLKTAKRIGIQRINIQSASHDPDDDRTRFFVSLGYCKELVPFPQSESYE